jgi:serine/threonine-protein kinase RsbW
VPPDPVRLGLDAPARPEVLDALHDLLGRAWARCPSVAGDDRMRVELAVAEIAANIVEHTAGDGIHIDMSADVVVHGDRVEVGLSDTGQEVSVDFAAAGLPDDELAESGRGMALARAVVDEVSYRREGERNRWRIMRRRRP